MNLLNQKHLANQPRRILSCHTRDFIQKICYKKTASVDMTQHGFICDSKTQPVKLLSASLNSSTSHGNSPAESKPPRASCLPGSPRKPRYCGQMQLSYKVKMNAVINWLY
ncbi:hypothetical protein K1T71_014511 [Dendrolimus kikuchii]|uniref:Uncharacterized protein n=1 Tax=Dendrolimus kikuchii TaxID=765133 RepID=A0ACC1CE77_9NEOP|nr:hypothetical protein K1T71_014511 [Dendrolimus kikuchii]